MRLKRFLKSAAADFALSATPMTAQTAYTQSDIQIINDGFDIALQVANSRDFRATLSDCFEYNQNPRSPRLQVLQPVEAIVVCPRFNNDPTFYNYGTAMQRIYQGRYDNSLTGRTLLGYCINNVASTFSRIVAGNARSVNVRTFFSNAAQLTSNAQRIMDRRLFGGRANPANCRNVFINYTF